MDTNKTKIAIIGSQGYIGSYLSQELSQDKSIQLFNYSKTDRGIAQINFTATEGRNISSYSVNNFDVVIYVAGISELDVCLLYSLDEVTNKNVDDVYELALKMNSQQILIYASTSLVCDGHFDMKESDIINEADLSLYAKSYYMREKKLTELSVPKCIGLRLGSVVGISAVQKKSAYIAMMSDAFLKGFITVNNAKVMRAILGIRDLYRVIITLINSRQQIKNNKLYNISSFNCSIGCIANQVAKHTCAPIKFNEFHNKCGFSLDTTEFTTDFNFKFEATHEIIINELMADIEWICRDHDNKKVNR